MFFLETLGVPLGLFWSVLGATGMAVNLTDVKIYGPATAIMLLTITYGGLVSALGYFSTFKRSSPERHNNQKTAELESYHLHTGYFFRFNMVGHGQRSRSSRFY